MHGRSSTSPIDTCEFNGHLLKIDLANRTPVGYLALGLGAQKSYNSLYLMGAYASSNGEYTSPFSQKLLVDAFKKAGKRLDKGKCCLQFKKLDDLELTSSRR